MKPFSTLKGRLWLLILIVVVPSLALAITGYIQERRHAMEDLRHEVMVLLHAGLTEQNYVVEHTREVLRIMARADDLKVVPSDSCTALARRLLETQSTYVNFGVASLDGEVVCSARTPRMRVNNKDRRWFRETLQTRDFTAGSYQRCRISGQRVITFGYPLLQNDGTPRGAVFASAGTDWLKRIVRTPRLPQGWTATAMDREGHILARFPEPEKWEGRHLPETGLAKVIAAAHGETLSEIHDEDGVERWYAIAPLAATHGDVYLAVGGSKESWGGPIDLKFRGQLIVLFLLLCASVAFAWSSISQSFLHWARLALDAGKRLGAGDYASRLDYAGNVAELAEMSRNLNGLAENLQQREAQRQEAEAGQQLAARVFEGSEEGILVTDPEGRILTVNQAFTRVTGYTQDEAKGHSPRILNSGRHSADFFRAMWAQVGASGSWQGEIWNQRKNGEVYPEWLKISALFGPDGAVVNYIGMFSDITERKAADARIQQLSQYDALTGLPNRVLSQDRIEQAIAAARRVDRVVAVLLIDLDRFKLVNDSLGHGAGDQLLVEVGRRLGAAVRDGDTVARQGGDEFSVILADVGDENDVAGVANYLLEAIRQPLTVGGRETAPSASIGISLFPKDGNDAETLLKNADVALFRAKDAGRGTFRFFAAEMDTRAARWLALEDQLRQTLARNELELHYQPQVSLISGQVTGAEALLRWNNAELGQVSPVEFIPVAEDSGLILPIGEWVLRTACAQNKAWQDAGLPLLRVAVNLSARQFRHAGLVEQVLGILRETGLQAQYLELELTESVLMEDVDAAIAIMAELKEAGVSFSLDDFGTGYSSMSYLSRFAFDTLKIDQSFVRDITTNPINAAIATTTISMARNLRLNVVAEGVESEGQLNYLRNHRCDTMQGYHFSRPLPAGEFAALLLSGKALAPAEAHAGPQPTLLLVDDEANVVSALRRALRAEGYRILTASSAAQGLELLALHRVQVIVSDQRMPEMSGTDFLFKVKDLYPDTIRIVLSGYTDLHTVTEAVNRGAIYKFLLKPWDDDLLRAHLREAFRVAERLKED